MNNYFRTVAMALILAVAATLSGVLPYRPVHAQYGATTVPGFASAAVNAVVNAAIGSGGAVTNPASNFIMLVQGSTVYCSGSAQTFGQSTITLAASATYQIEWNCVNETLYAKKAVTGPGTSSPDQPGVPATFLAPVFGIEVPLATVVCNATACGNGGNGSITDARPLASFPGAGLPLNTTLQANLPSTNVTNGTVIFCTDCTTASACTGAGTGAMAVRQNAAWKCF